MRRCLKSWYCCISHQDSDLRTTYVHLQREESLLRLEVTSGSGVRKISVGWGSKYWVFLYINSDESDNLTEFGAYTETGYATFFVSGTTNLTNASTLLVGNSHVGDTPARLIKRV